MTEAYSVAVRQPLRVKSSESCKVMLTLCTSAHGPLKVLKNRPVKKCCFHFLTQCALCHTAIDDAQTVGVYVTVQTHHNHYY